MFFQDTISLVVQSIGGGIASGTQPGLASGGHITLGGIVLQLGLASCHRINRNQLHWPLEMLAVVLILHAGLAAEFLIRSILDRPTRCSREVGIISLLRGVGGHINEMHVDWHVSHWHGHPHPHLVDLSDHRALRRLERQSSFDSVALQYVSYAPPLPGPFHVRGADDQTDVFGGAMVALVMFMQTVPPWGAVVWTCRTLSI